MPVNQAVRARSKSTVLQQDEPAHKKINTMPFGSIFITSTAEVVASKYGLFFASLSSKPSPYKPTREKSKDIGQFILKIEGTA